MLKRFFAILYNQYKLYITNYIISQIVHTTDREPFTCLVNIQHHDDRELWKRLRVRVIAPRVCEWQHPMCLWQHRACP